MKMRAPFLIGERLSLRPLDVQDLERCLRWINDPEILQFLGRRRPMSREMETAWLAAQYKDERQINFAITLNEGDRHIGNCGLDTLDTANRSACFGILIGEKDAWSQGYGSEAARLVLGYGFQQLNLHRIELEVFSLNHRAIRAYEKLGFVHEGVKRESYFRNGAFHDTLVMGLLESEWRDG